MRSLLCPKFDFVEFSFKFSLLLAMLITIGALNYDYAVEDCYPSLSLLPFFLVAAFLLLLHIALFF